MMSLPRLRLIVSRPPGGAPSTFAEVRAERRRWVERLVLLVRALARADRQDLCLVALLEEALVDTSRVIRDLEREAARLSPQRWAASQRRRMGELSLGEWNLLIQNEHDPD
jgi:hypothetical protein